MKCQVRQEWLMKRQSMPWLMQLALQMSCAMNKRKLESEMQTLHGDMDEMSSEARMADEKAKHAMVDAARLADELRNEQEIAQAYEKDRKLFECQIKDMQSQLDE